MGYICTCTNSPANAWTGILIIISDTISPSYQHVVRQLIEGLLQEQFQPAGGNHSYWIRFYSQCVSACLWTSIYGQFWLVFSPMIMPSGTRDTSLTRLTVSRITQSTTTVGINRNLGTLQLACRLLADSLSTACPTSAGDARMVIFRGCARHGQCIHAIHINQKGILCA